MSGKEVTFKVGDRVKVIVDDGWKGQVGEITSVDGDTFQIKFDRPAEIWFGNEELEKE